MAKTVLIVSNSADLHVDLLIPILHAKRCAVFRIDLDAFPRDYQSSQCFAGGSVRQSMRHLPSGQVLDLADVGAIWSRKPAEFSFLSPDLGLQERIYARAETEQALFGMLYTLDCFWISHPLALRGAMWKGEQLQRAARMGFRIPASLTTNVPAEVRAFRASFDGPMIFKALSSPNLGGDDLTGDERVAQGLGTTVVDDTMLENLDAVAELACHFQEYIPKQYELRVTVIGERLFAARIHSQDDPRTAIDSRDMSADIRYEAIVLPATLSARCLDFVRSYGLAYGALDLIVTPDEEVVFLENNPVGQFLYIEQLIPGFALLEALADRLIEECV
jgi:glutathione synthase/RimK-type ligase-like ATP-grasp enzyme